jgi:hypothetical protein
MRNVAENFEAVNVREVKVCTKTGILSGQGSKNLLFCQEMQRNVLSKGKF